MAELYRNKVTDLAKALEHHECRSEATETLRGLIDAIVLTPDQGELRIELKGNLAAMLSAATNAKRSPETGDLSLQSIVGCGGVQPAVLAAVEWGCMTPGGGPLDFEARQRNTAVHRSIRFRFRPG